MVQRYVIAIAAIFLLNTCDLVSPKSPSLPVNHDDALEDIDFTSVDTYPIFVECKALTEKELQWECFGETLIQHLQESIQLKSKTMPSHFKDTVKVDLLVGQDYRVKVASIQTSPAIANYIPELDSLLIAHVKLLPSVLHPAIKQGITVTSQYQLPIVISTED